MLNPWLALSFKVFQLGIEAQSVVALRMMRLASGGAGTQAEMGRMMVEKAAAVTEAQFAAATAAVAGSKDHVIAGRHLRSSENECGPIGDAFHVVKSASLLFQNPQRWHRCGLAAVSRLNVINQPTAGCRKRAANRWSYTIGSRHRLTEESHA